MNAVVITKAGTPDVLQLEERSCPIPAANEVLIRVRAAGINRLDIFQRKGNYPAPAGVVDDIPGLEVAGVIEKLGVEVKGWRVGDRVCALIAGGGYAEYAVADEGSCLLLPEEVDFESGAALPETVFTVWDNVFRRANLAAGETILIHGGSGGIGSTAIQLAKLFGARVLTSTGSEEKVSYCRKLGADRVVNYRKEDFAQVFADEQVQVILDSVGGDYFQRNIDVLQADGRLVYINAIKGGRVDINLLQLMNKRIMLTGSTLRSRDLGFKKSLAKDVESFVWPLLEKSFRPSIYKVFSLGEAAEAHRLMEKGGFFGKLVFKLA